jgi:hypothetical protein
VGAREADQLLVTQRLRVLAIAALLGFPATAVAANAPPRPGSVTVSSTTHTSAQVTAHLDLDRDDSYYGFEFGPTTAYGQASSIGFATQDGDVSRVLSGLSAGTTYHVRLVAWNEKAGYGRGPDRAFTTVASSVTPPPATPPTSTPPPGATPTPGPGDTPPPGDPAASGIPMLGETVGLRATSGVVQVRPPGSPNFLALSDLASLPVGTVVDTRRGTVELRSALPDGTTQSGSFHGSRFEVRQKAGSNGLTNLYLRGSFSGCRTSATSSTRLASAAAKRPKAVRRLWGKDSGGRFRTHGRDGVATVRGTIWSTADRCDGTLTRVTEGAVDVKVRATGRVVRVSAGQRHLARHRR